jgi:hypothetical protein
MRKAKCAGYLFQNKAATTAGLMDNAIQAVQMDLRTGKQHAQEAEDPYYSMIRDIWTATDAELDEVKTICSLSKFIYFNGLFGEGTEVLTPLKMYACTE